MTVLRIESRLGKVLLQKQVTQPKYLCMVEGLTPPTQILGRLSMTMMRAIFWLNLRMEILALQTVG